MALVLRWHNKRLERPPKQSQWRKRKVYPAPLKRDPLGGATKEVVLTRQAPNPNRSIRNSAAGRLGGGPLISDLHYGGGTVVFEDFNITPNVPLAGQLGSLKEDMLQIQFPGGYLVDVGWYPSFSPSGRFVVLVVKNEDWDVPVSRTECNTLEDLRSSLCYAVGLIESQRDP